MAADDPLETSEPLNFARLVFFGVQLPGELRTRAHSQLGVDVGEVAGNRPFSEEQCSGDFPVRSTLGNQGGDATLRRGQALLVHAPADASELGQRPPDPGGRPELLEAAERGGNRVAGGALHPCPSSDGAERKRGSSAAEGIADLLVLCYRLFQENGGATDIPLRSGDETSASHHLCEHPLTAKVSAPERNE
jgi:hypothetical protein